MDADALIPTFLAVTGIEDESVAKQYLQITNNDLEYAVTLYMESNPPQNASSGNQHGEDDDDEQLAQRLQQEAYQSGGGPGGDDDVRQADANIHRHETLVDSFDTGYPQMPHFSRPTDIFGQGRVGIFNQRFGDEEYNRFEELDNDDDEDDEDYPDMEENDSDDDEVMVLNSDGEVVESNSPPLRSARRINRNNRINELTSTQKRLANLFRPPFDIMLKFDLDTAKLQGREDHKWILVNIQDSSEFTCQVLNRDFWSNTQIKSKVKENFLFLQYQHDSPNGVNYTNFYSTDKFPHISILDPLTGERVFKWTDGEVPDIECWLDDVNKFLDKFSLLPNSKNPTVKHEAKFDPDSLTEEQQIEFALKQSMGNSGNDAENAIDIDEEESETEGNGIENIDKNTNGDNDESILETDSTQDLFSSVKPINHEEPTTGSITRIQIRFPNGKRLIHKFDIDNDKVITIYQWLKFILSESNNEEYGLSLQDRFNLSNGSNRSFKFIDSLNLSIGEAELKNASVLLEKE